MTNELRTQRMHASAERLRERALATPDRREQAELLSTALAWDRAAERNRHADEPFLPRRYVDPEKVRAWQLKASQLRLRAAALSDSATRRALLTTARQLERAARCASFRN